MTMSTLDGQPMAAADCKMWCMHSSDAVEEHFRMLVGTTMARWRVEHADDDDDD